MPRKGRWVVEVCRTRQIPQALPFESADVEQIEIARDERADHADAYMDPIAEILHIESALRILAGCRMLAADEPERAEQIDAEHRRRDERRMMLKAGLTPDEDLALELARANGKART